MKKQTAKPYSATIIRIFGIMPNSLCPNCPFVDVELGHDIPATKGDVRCLTGDLIDFDPAAVRPLHWIANHDFAEKGRTYRVLIALPVDSHLLSTVPCSAHWEF